MPPGLTLTAILAVLIAGGLFLFFRQKEKKRSQ